VASKRNSEAMRSRRARILEEARLLLGDGGVEALSIRKLAEAADVASRTIYSLIGQKEDVLIALYAELQAKLLKRLASRPAQDPLTQGEDVAVEVAALLREDEDYSRAALLAIQHLDTVWPPRRAVIDLFASVEGVLTESFQRCVAAGLLRGHVPVAQLARLTLQSYRMTWMQWACRQIDLDRALADALLNFRIILMADATSEFRDELVRRV
jgi:AcrR family transcriptional regulator